MTTPTTTLAEWLLVQIAEDEVVAQAAVLPAHDGYKPHPELAHWRYAEDGEVEVDYDDPGPYPDVIRVTQDSEGLTPAIWNPVHGHHIARWDPARVLAECAAKRRIVELAWHHFGDEDFAGGMEYAKEQVLKILAAVYADREGYREEWRP